MKNSNNKQMFCRIMIYVVGLLSLALGLSLNTQVMLGVSPIISTAYTMYSLTSLNFGNATLIIYSLFIVVEIIIHICLKKQKMIVTDLLQLPFSIVFTRFLNLFKDIIPDFAVDLNGTFLGTIPGRLLFLAIAIIFTGIGATLTLNMRIIPNPGDGIVQAIADVIHKKVGFTKNCVDVTCVCISCIVGMAADGHIYGIGIGTICAMILVGRVIALINHLFRTQMFEAAGLEETDAAYLKKAK